MPSTSKPHPHATLLNALVDMQQSPLYAARRSILEQAELLIVNLSAKLAAIPAWQPIETAPKDGTRVSLCSHSGNVASGYWEHYTTSWWDWPFSFEEPTRWMPLPAPPKEAT